MLTMPSFKKSLIVEQFQGNYLKNLCYLQVAVVSCPANINVMTSDVISSSDKLFPSSS